MTLQTQIPTYPPHPLEPRPQKVAIANAFDVKAQDYRDKKTEEFALLIDNAMTHAAQQIKDRSASDAEVVKRNVVPIHNRDSVDAFIRSAGATHGIFIASYDAHFIQTRVDVTKTETGKDREAFYDLMVEVKYVLRSLEGLSFDTLVSVQRFHSSRSVLSGLLAAGPSIVSNQDDAQEATLVNVDQYLKSFFLGQEPRVRQLPFPKEFKAIEEAVRQYNYTGAFEESKKLTASADKKISANAYYICAVLAEREEDFQSAKMYLKESLMRQNNPLAQDMLADYRYMPNVK
jgi:PIN domain nuclease of toxin-antitoxin system